MYFRDMHDIIVILSHITVIIKIPQLTKKWYRLQKGVTRVYWAGLPRSPSIWDLGPSCPESLYFTEDPVIHFNHKPSWLWSPESVISHQRGPYSNGARWILRAESKTSQIGCICFVTVCWKVFVDFGLGLAFSGANII